MVIIITRHVVIEPHMSYSLNSVIEGYRRDYIGNFYRGYKKDCRSLDYSSCVATDQHGHTHTHTPSHHPCHHPCHHPSKPTCSSNASCEPQCSQSRTKLKIACSQRMNASATAVIARIRNITSHEHVSEVSGSVALLARLEAGATSNGYLPSHHVCCSFKVSA